MSRTRLLEKLEKAKEVKRRQLEATSTSTSTGTSTAHARKNSVSYLLNVINAKHSAGC